MDTQAMIKALRSAGLTQSAIAERTGLSQGYICDLEQGRHGKRVGHSVFQRIAALYFSISANAKESSNA
jgi:transcriptional regulator with XRE-family HTH domain